MPHHTSRMSWLLWLRQCCACDWTHILTYAFKRFGWFPGRLKDDPSVAWFRPRTTWGVKHGPRGPRPCPAAKKTAKTQNCWFTSKMFSIATTPQDLLRLFNWMQMQNESSRRILFIVRCEVSALNAILRPHANIEGGIKNSGQASRTASKFFAVLRIINDARRLPKKMPERA